MLKANKDMLEKGVKYVKIKSPERHQWRRSGFYY